MLRDILDAKYLLLNKFSMKILCPSLILRGKEVYLLIQDLGRGKEGNLRIQEISLLK
jgi:hypothetical protein